MENERDQALDPLINRNGLAKNERDPPLDPSVNGNEPTENERDLALDPLVNGNAPAENERDLALDPSVNGSKPAENIELNAIIQIEQDPSNEKDDWNELARKIYLKEFSEKGKYIEELYNGIAHIPRSVLEKKDTGGMCILHRVLLTLLDIPKEKNDGTTNAYRRQLLEIVKMLLIKSDTGYSDYTYTDDSGAVQRKVISELLNKKYAKIQEKSQAVISELDVAGRLKVFYLMKQILNDEEDTFINLLEKSDVANKRYLSQFECFKDLLEASFVVGSLDTLIALLKYGLDYHPDFNTKFNKDKIPLLNIALSSRIYVKCENLQNYYECIDYILNLEYIDVNMKLTENGDTALHIVRDPVLMNKLIDRRACFNVLNKQKELPIDNPCLTFEMFQRNLDACVSDGPGAPVLEDGELWESIKFKRKNSKDNFENQMFLNLNSITRKSETKDTEAKCSSLLKFIIAIRDSEKLSQAIDHPCIATLLDIYWDSVHYLVLFNGLPMLIVSILILLLKISTNTGSCSPIYPFFVTIFCGIAFVYNLSTYILDNYVVWTKGSLWCNSDVGWKDKFQQFLEKNFLNHILFALRLFCVTSLVIWYSSNCKQNEWLAVAFISSSIQITLFISILNKSFAITLMMLYRVVKSTIFYLIPMCFIFIGFAWSFEMEVGGFGEFNSALPNATEKIEATFLQTAFQALGEFDGRNLSFKNSMGCVLIIFFILIISIALLNMLNGLAFNDVQNVKRQANYLYRIFQLWYLSSISKNKEGFCEKLYCCPFLLSDHDVLSVHKETGQSKSIINLKEKKFKRLAKIDNPLRLRLLDILQCSEKHHCLIKKNFDNISRIKFDRSVLITTHLNDDELLKSFEDKKIDLKKIESYSRQSKDQVNMKDRDEDQGHAKERVSIKFFDKTEIEKLREKFTIDGRARIGISSVDVNALIDLLKEKGIDEQNIKIVDEIIDAPTNKILCVKFGTKAEMNDMREKLKSEIKDASNELHQKFKEKLNAYSVDVLRTIETYVIINNLPLEVPDEMLKAELREYGRVGKITCGKQKKIRKVKCLDGSRSVHMKLIKDVPCAIYVMGFKADVQIERKEYFVEKEASFNLYIYCDNANIE
uniref:CSON008412 protein n=1 Tax=Culicoides sonorensis TaxID=179676 RepID=A0A336KG96_CULSO